MIKLDSYTDENVFENAKKYIKENFKTGDYFRSSLLQRTFSIGYNKAFRVLEMLNNDNIIKLDPKGVNDPVVL